MQELLVYSHGMLFLFYAALALKDDAHVRVDIFYRELSDKRKRMVNIFGNLFFLQPFAWVILIFSFEYVYFAWSINEISPEPGGLPFVYLFKTSLIIFPVLLILQSFSELIKLVFKNDWFSATNPFCLGLYLFTFWFPCCFYFGWGFNNFCFDNKFFWCFWFVSFRNSAK